MSGLTKHEKRLQKQQERKQAREEQSKYDKSSAKNSNTSNYIIGFLVIVIALIFFTSSNNNASAYYPTADDDPAIGAINAPIEIIVFGDMECPFTKKWALNTFEQIKDKHGENVRIVYRDFPKYDKHKFAENAAEATECAGDQDKYWDYFTKVFQMQSALSNANLKQYAVDLGLDSKEFDECLDSSKYEKEVRADRADGAKAGVITTPTFFINGNKIEGAQELGAFDMVIEQLMA